MISAAGLALLVAFSGAADQHWSERDTPSKCSTITHRDADLPPDQDARAWMLGDTGEPFRLEDGSCLVEYDTATFGSYMRWIYNPRSTRSERRWAAKELCAKEVHEEGHLDGKEHTRTGIMVSGQLPIPYRCKVIVRKVVR